MESVYDLYQRGCDLLDHGDHQAAIVPLSRARDLEPDKASIREALGRALFHARRYDRAAEEFQAVAARTPTNDYALFCLGRSMQLLGRHREACKPLALACSMCPERGLPAVSRPRSPQRGARLDLNDAPCRCYARSRAFVSARRCRQQYREWAQARFFCVRSDLMSALQTDIERRLAQTEPDLEVLLAEVVGGRCLRVFIDHPDGVTLAMCERVTMLLNDLRERYSLEVSSPGTDRPLTKPSHYRRFLGRRARVRTRNARVAGDVSDPGAPGARPVRSFTGELVGASEEEITLAADGGVIAIPYSEIRRSNLIED